jgi:hypothetical protein
VNSAKIEMPDRTGSPVATAPRGVRLHQSDEDRGSAEREKLIMQLHRVVQLRG